MYLEYAFINLLLFDEQFVFDDKLYAFELEIRGATSYRLGEMLPEDIEFLGVRLWQGEFIPRPEADLGPFEPYPLPAKRTKTWERIKNTLLSAKKNPDEIHAWLKKEDPEAKMLTRFVGGNPGHAAFFAVLTDKDKALHFKMRFG